MCMHICMAIVYADMCADLGLDMCIATRLWQDGPMVVTNVEPGTACVRVWHARAHPHAFIAMGAGGPAEDQGVKVTY